MSLREAGALAGLNFIEMLICGQSFMLYQASPFGRGSIPLSMILISMGCMLLWTLVSELKKLSIVSHLFPLLPFQDHAMCLW